MIKRTFLAVSIMAAAIGLIGCGSPDPTPPVRVSIIGLNDFHGALQATPANVVVADPANPAGTRVSVGGAAFLGTMITKLKSENPGNTLVVGAGDMVGATPVISALFNDEPTIDVLNMIGMDISSVGNHEFDKGAAELQRLQKGGCLPRSADGLRGIVGVDTCMNNGKFAGAKFQYLAANVIDVNSKQTVLPAFAIRTVAGQDIAFIGLTLKNTPSVVTPAGVAGLSFTDEVATVNSLVPELLAKGVSAIVVLIHEGGMTTASTINDKSCPGISGDIVKIADRFDPRVDAVISGHTHQEYVCTRPDGKLLTQTGFNGRAVTKIDMMISPDTKRVISKTANNFPVINNNVVMVAGAPVPLPAGVTPLTPDPAVAALVQRVVTLSAPLTSRVIGNIPMPLTRTANMAGESQVGSIIADAYLDGTSGPSFGSNPAEIGLTNSGGIRANLPNTVVTFGDLFTVTPFGNNLVTIDLTGTQLLRVLEQQWEAPQPVPGRIMQVSNGFTYTWDASKPFGAPSGMGNRVIASSMKLKGVPIEMSRTYRVTINNFMASGGDNYTVFIQGKNSQSSDIDIDAGVAYFRKLGTVPTPPLNRITRIN